MRASNTANVSASGVQRKRRKKKRKKKAQTLIAPAPIANAKIFFAKVYLDLDLEKISIGILNVNITPSFLKIL